VEVIVKNAQSSGSSYFLLLAALAAGCASAADEGMDGDVGRSDQDLCSALSVVSNDADGQAVPGTNITWTATPTCTGTPQYSFWVRNPAGTWSLGQNWSASASFVWNTNSLATGAYTIQARVRDVAGSDAYYQKSVNAKFTLTASNPCTSVTTTATPTTTWVGQSVTFNSTAAGCTNPSFEVYHLDPGSATWTLLSAYSTSNASYVWNSTGAPAGTHRFSFWARGQGSLKTKEASTSPKYVLQPSSPCTGAGIALSPGTHTSVGNTVTITGSASGCGGAPTYKYYVFTPGASGSWVQLQDWTTSNKATWNTRLWAPGLYTVKVFVRVTGSTKSYDATNSDGYTLDAATPTSALAIHGGWENFCELLGSGKVGCWGYNANGELGNGSGATISSSPVAVTGITQAVGLSTGYSHSCAIVVGGGVRCWGSNLHGQLGNGSTTDSSTPVNVSSMASAAALASGNSHACAALVDGSVKCWGYNSRGQLGNGVGPDSSVPVSVSGISTASQVSAGYYHSCALLTDGTVKCWGTNLAGELGNGTGTNSPTPVTVTGLTNVTTISSSSGNSCAVKSDGTIWCWGANSAYGTLGDGSTSSQLTPVQVTGITNAKDVAVGIYHACAALQDGTARCWGYNIRGQLGNATNTDSLSPVPVSNITNAVSIAVSYYSSCATLADNTAVCWGHGTNGELGRGSTANSNIPVAVSAVP
jgi:alpha-tubulin suppressor-like RCC1 family protein